MNEIRTILLAFAMVAGSAFASSSWAQSLESELASNPGPGPFEDVMKQAEKVEKAEKPAMKGKKEKKKGQAKTEASVEAPKPQSSWWDYGEYVVYGLAGLILAKYFELIIWTLAYTAGGALVGGFLGSWTVGAVICGLYGLFKHSGSRGGGYSGYGGSYDDTFPHFDTSPTHNINGAPMIGATDTYGNFYGSTFNDPH